MAATLLKAATKVGVAAGAVYITAEQGIWSTENYQRSKAVSTITGSVLPATREYVQQIPSASKVGNYMGDKWNSGVKTTFQALSHAPETTKVYTKRALTSTKQFIQQKS